MEVNVTARNQTVQSNASMLYWMYSPVRWISLVSLVSRFTFMRHSTAEVDSYHIIRVQWIVILYFLLHFFSKLYLQIQLCQHELFYSNMELLESFFGCKVAAVCISHTHTYSRLQSVALTREASSPKEVLHTSLFTYFGGFKVPTPNCSLHSALAHMMLLESHVDSVETVEYNYSRCRLIHLPLKSHACPLTNISGNPQAAISLCRSSLSLCVRGPHHTTSLVLGGDLWKETPHVQVCCTDNNEQRWHQSLECTSYPMTWLVVNSSNGKLFDWREIDLGKGGNAGGYYIQGLLMVLVVFFLPQNQRD